MTKYLDADARPVDPFGRVVPHQFSFLTFVKSIPGFFNQFAPIPNEFWTEDVADGEKVAVVGCPCGEEPCVPVNSLVECVSCDRVFAFTGNTVRVANSPKGQKVNAGPAEPLEEDPEV